VVVDDEDAGGHGLLIGTRARADKRNVRGKERDRYVALIREEVLLFGLLGASLSLFAVDTDLPNTYSLPEARLVLDTAVMLACAVVSVLAWIRFTVEGRRLDLALAGGFFASAVSTFAFAVVPVLGGEPLHRAEVWAGVGGRLLATAMIAVAAFARGRVEARRPAAALFPFVAALLLLLWVACRRAGDSLPALASGPHGRQPYLLTAALAALAVLSLAAFVGFALRFRRQGEDLDRWLAEAATLSLFAELHYVFTPLLSSSYVSQGDFLRLLSYGVLLVGVWRAIRASEFGRAVAEERARVAREIHDGLAQYLFAISTQISLLERGAPTEPTVARLKESAAAAQQEARFAVLALSSASGNAPFDAALRRYVEFLTADGELEVDLEIGDVRLGPDEQIELFRIVQEGLANVRRHANARRAEVTIGERGGRRRVTIRDDGRGLAEPETSAGQGLKNIRARAASIGGAFSLTSRPGQGTALEVTLRV
jgi:signal transduction histidine kinase